MPKQLFPLDERIAECACGWGAALHKTVSQVRGHRVHGRYPQCAEEIRIIDDDPKGPAHQEPDEAEEDARDVLDAGNESPARDAPAARNGNGSGPVPVNVERPQRGGGALGDRKHYGEYTPIRTTVIAPALLHAYYDWFCKGDPAAPGSAYEGDFQTWLCTLALDCLKEHWALDFAVTIRPRTGGNTNGRHTS